ncbi:FecCD family ABC transporter permease [Rothia sp. ZJ932]|uniref:FecCD family ABC transporter permease n=1 Tax=Rothia sp. ZJ932 TaxID=2810516 RepID=UPI00351C8F71
MAVTTLLPVSTARRKHFAGRWFFLALGVVALVVSVLISITLGSADISMVNVRDIVTNHVGLTEIPVRLSEDAIVWEDRLPRVLVAAACGIGLSLCGLLLQSLLRNSLADPYILGVSSGASTGAVVTGMLGLGGGAIGLSGGAFIGALIAFAAVLVIAKCASGDNSAFILAGVSSTQLFSALTSLIIFAFADSDEARGVMFWLLGSLEGVRWNQVYLSVAVAVAALVLCLAFTKTLDVMTFGEDMAGALGVNTTVVRMLLLTSTALVTAVLVSVAGAIGFVGLVIPHIARLICGYQHRLLVPFSAVFGAIFMVWVDTFSRIIFAPSALPIGVGTAIVGVPVFIVILLRKKARV